MLTQETQKCHQCKMPTSDPFACSLCGSLSCKNCVSFVSEDAFSFMKSVPKNLRHSHYCAICFSTEIAPELRKYKGTMAKAREVYIVERAPRKPLPILKKSVELLNVRGCPDREETILRLAFLSAEMGFNAVIKVKLLHEKVRNAGFQKMIWHGTGIPVELDARRVEHEEKVNLSV